jgi:hypothetical protein
MPYPSLVQALRDIEAHQFTSRPEFTHSPKRRPGDAPSLRRSAWVGCRGGLDAGVFCGQGVRPGAVRWAALPEGWSCCALRA